MTIEIDGKILERDNEGFLLNPADWNHEVAEKIAEEWDLELSEKEWEVVNIVRSHYEERQSVPEARVILKALRERMGKENATRKYLYSMFPYGYGQQACKIAGMRKPLKIMLDV